MLTQGMKERKAVALTEMAWGAVDQWYRAGKIQGDLTLAEFQKAIEPLFREALELPTGSVDREDGAKIE